MRKFCIDLNIYPVHPKTRFPDFVNAFGITLCLYKEDHQEEDLNPDLIVPIFQEQVQTYLTENQFDGTPKAIENLINVLCDAMAEMQEDGDCSGFIMLTSAAKKQYRRLRREGLI